MVWGKEIAVEICPATLELQQFVRYFCILTYMQKANLFNKPILKHGLLGVLLQKIVIC